jgi:hypothetical protein
MYSNKILSFIQQLKFPFPLSNGIEILYPFSDEAVMKTCKLFYEKYYADNNPRTLIIGINPGRFGAGVTGIPFTDPIRLKENCGINHSWPLKQELSSVFIYEMINEFGTVKDFYGKFFVTAVSPLGFIQNKRNLNYYDNRDLQSMIKPFVIDCFEKQIAFGINTNKAFCLGDGKNYSYLCRLNDEYKFFKKIIPLSHPRFIMQYKLKMKQDYIKKYLDELRF